ncbi:MAG: hypothetical protein IPJ18_19055 [Betaproteobacteria bacterium]|nr:hypothetical protein [Betaproteobacteria bacterium]
MVKDILIGRILRGITDREDFSLASWPEPDIGALAPKALDLFLRRKEAVLMYLQGSDGAAISAATGVHPRFVNRTIRERCMHPHPDGRVYGWRGLIPGLHISKYHRKSKIGVDAKGGGVAGALSNLLLQEPDFTQRLDKQIIKTCPDLKLGQIRRPRHALCMVS